MTATVALLVAAVGAILNFAVADHVDGVNLHTIGVILMVVGAVGLLLGAVQYMAARHHTVDRQVVDGPGGTHERIVQH